jgi:hypothetical protein
VEFGLDAVTEYTQSKTVWVEVAGRRIDWPG